MTKKKINSFRVFSVVQDESYKKGTEKRTQIVVLSLSNRKKGYKKHKGKIFLD